MRLNDIEIEELARQGMIDPFEPGQVTEVKFQMAHLITGGGPPARPRYRTG